MENWKERLADMLVGSRHNFTLREELERFISQELDKAREEGYQKGWKDGRSKAQEEFANWRRSR